MTIDIKRGTDRIVWGSVVGALLVLLLFLVFGFWYQTMRWGWIDDRYMEQLIHIPETWLTGLLLLAYGLLIAFLLSRLIQRSENSTSGE